MAERRFDLALKQALIRWNETERQREQTEEIPEMSAAFLERMHSRIRDDDRIIWEGKRMKQKKTWKKWWTAGVCAALVLAGTGCVYAVSPAVRAYINMLFLQDDSGGRITEVPEGWVGVYTADDLEKIREDLSGEYILMNDIVIPDAYYAEGGIYEDGFMPIGGEIRYELDLYANGTPRKNEDGSLKQNIVVQPFTGTFNGNGYVISNVHVKQFSGGNEAPAGHLAGLFGKCKITAGEPILDEATQEHYRDYTGGIIKNLGITDSSVEITITGDTRIYGSSYINIGMIAGECDLVAGCFTENVEIKVVLDESVLRSEEDLKRVFGQIKIGGVAGKTIITDSCYSDAKITLVNNSAAEIENPYVAGVVGFTNSCVTSYFNGEIQSVSEDYGVAGFDKTTPPVLLNDTVMEEIKTRMMALNDEFNLMKMQSFYVYCRADAMQMYITEDLGETGRYFYLLDPETKERERKELSRILSTIFTGEEFMRICQENDVKYGGYSNYDLRQTADGTFDGFDFERIWTMGKDGLPKLRLFTWSKETGAAIHDNPLQDVVRY